MIKVGTTSSHPFKMEDTTILPWMDGVGGGALNVSETRFPI